MIVASLIAFSAGFLGGILGYYLFSWMTRRLLYQLSVDVADLQDRHLRSVRKAAAKERWDEDDQIDMKLEGLIHPTAKPKGWTKWGSSRESKSSENP